MVVEALVQGRAAGNEMLSSESQATKQLLVKKNKILFIVVKYM